MISLAEMICLRLTPVAKNALVVRKLSARPGHIKSLTRQSELHYRALLGHYALNQLQSQFFL